MKIKFNLVEFGLSVPIAIVGMVILWWQVGGWVAFGVFLVAFAAGLNVVEE